MLVLLAVLVRPELRLPRLRHLLQLARAAARGARRRRRRRWWRREEGRWTRPSGPSTWRVRRYIFDFELLT
jgi:hypothetical protein